MFKKKNISNLFYLFLIAHLFVWTLIPSITNNNLPLDTIEALAWGSNLDWGYNKHPPVSAFVVEFFYFLFGSNDIAYYFLSQIFVISAFYIVWIFSNEFFQNDFVTIKYAFNRAGLVDYSFLNHLKFPIIFLIKQIGILIPFFVLCYFIIKKMKIRFDIKDKKNILFYS